MKTMNKKVIIASLLGIASLATIGSTLAFNGQSQDRSQLDDSSRVEIRAERQAAMEEKRADMMEIMNNADYDAWKEIAQDDMLEIINTEDKFEQLVEMHEHLESAKEIREELGLPERKMQRPDMKNPNMNNQGMRNTDNRRLFNK